MSLEVQCGTGNRCDECPFKDYTKEWARDLGTIAACYAEDNNIPGDIPIDRLASVIGIEVTNADRARVRTAVVNMSLDKCEIKE
jgi:hypothetical protein